MQFFNLLTTALTLATGAISAITTADLQSPLDTLVSNVKARNAAVNNTVALFKAQSISLDLAKAYIDGNMSAIRGIADDFKATATGLMSSLNLTGSAIGPDGSIPAGRYNSKTLPQRVQDAYLESFGDVSYTLKSVQDDPILGLATEVLFYTVLAAETLYGIATFLVIFAYDELFLPGGYPWGAAIPY